MTGTDDGFEVDFTDEAGETAGHADIHFEIVEGEGPEDFPEDLPAETDPAVIAKLGDVFGSLMAAAFGDVTPEEGLPEDISPEEADAMIEKAMDDMPEELREWLEANADEVEDRPRHHGDHDHHDHDHHDHDHHDHHDHDHDHHHHHHHHHHDYY